MLWAARDSGKGVRGVEIIIKCSVVKNSFVLRAIFFYLVPFAPFLRRFLCVLVRQFPRDALYQLCKNNVTEPGARVLSKCLAGGMAINLALIDLKRWN